MRTHKTIVAVLLLAPLVAPGAESPYGFRPQDFDVFDRSDVFAAAHNVARVDVGTTVTLRRPGGGSAEPVKSVNDGVIVETRSAICQLPGTGGELEFQFQSPRTVQAVRVFSGDLPNNWDLPSSEASIRRFRVEGRVDGKWGTLGETAQALPSYFESAISNGPWTHHAVVSFPPHKVEAVRLISLETNDTGQRMDPPEQAPPEKRIALIREVEIFSTAPELGPVVFPLKRLVESDWTLPAYLNLEQATLVVLPRPWLREAMELEIAFRKETSGEEPAPPARIRILPEEKPQRFSWNIALWPDGEYVTTVRRTGADSLKAGEIRRRLIKQTLRDPKPPAEPLAVKGLSMIPVDDWYFTETRNVKRVLHPAEQFPIVDKPLEPERIRMDGLSLKLDASGDLLVEIEDMDRYSQNPQRHTFRSKDGIHWQMVQAARTSSAGSLSPALALVNPLQLLAVAAPVPARSKPKSPAKGTPDDNQAKWKYQSKNALVAAQPHRYYDAGRDGPVDLTQVQMRYSRHYPPKWGDIEIPAYTAWPVWRKASDDYVILTRQPLTEHIKDFYSEDLAGPQVAGDGWFGGFPEISTDKKTIYWTQYRMIPRFPPFRVGYDLARGAARNIVIWSSQDGIHWRQTFTTLPAEEDEIGTQHYGGTVMHLEGGRLHLCYQWTYRAARQQMHLDLAFSRDLQCWHRIPGPPFSPNGPVKSWNYGFATTVQSTEVEKSGYSYRLTGRDCSTPHFGWEVLNRQHPLETFTGKWLEKRFDGLGLRQMPNWADFGSYDRLAEHIRTSACRTVGILRYRKNGWVSLQPEGNQPGVLVTKLLKPGRVLTLNAKTEAEGSIRVEVLDEHGNALPAYAGSHSARFQGDSIAGPISWSGGSLRTLPEKPLRLRLIVDRADLYALNF